jgi:hypothetical protein
MDNLIEAAETFLITLVITGTNAKTIDIIVTMTIDRRRISTLDKNRNHKTATVNGLTQSQPTSLNPFRLQSKNKRPPPSYLPSKSQVHLQEHLKLRRLKLKVLLYLIHHRNKNKNQNQNQNQNKNQSQNRYRQKCLRRLLKMSGNGRRRQSSKRTNPIILQMRLASHCQQNIMTRNMSNRYTKHRIGQTSNSTPRLYGMVSFLAEIPSLSSRPRSLKVLGVKGPKVGRLLNNTPNEVTQMTILLLNDH